LSLQPDAGRIRTSEEFIRDQTVVDAQPVRELPLGASHTGQTGDPRARGYVSVEHVAEIAGTDYLRRITLRRIGRPYVEVVPEFRGEKPAGKRQEELVQLKVFALFDVEGVAE